MKKLFSFLFSILTFAYRVTVYIVVAVFKITDGIIGKYFIAWEWTCQALAC